MNLGLYIIHRRNDYAKVGSYWELTDDGWEQVLLEKQENGSFRPSGYTGLILPHGALGDYVINIRSNGFDDTNLGPRRKRAHSDSVLGNLDDGFREELDKFGF